MGRLDNARAAVEQRLALSPEFSDEPRFAVGYGRVLIADGQAARAVAVLQRVVDGFSDLPAELPEVAEARFWLGHARVAAGDVRGRRLIEQARPALARSGLSVHRRLAAAAARPL
jgi:hypothetical protein